MAKDSGEFVEVFRSITAMDRTANKRRASSDRTSGRGKTPAGDADVSRRIRIDLSVEALVISVFVLLCVVVAAYVLGYRRRDANLNGRMTPRPAYSEPTGPVRSAATNTDSRSVNAQSLNLRTAPGRTAPFYTVRIIGGIRLDRAREIRDDLRQKGYDAFVTKSNNTYAVNVGEFVGLRDSAAVAMREKFVTVQYKGGQWFASAYIVQIKNNRSIIK